MELILLDAGKAVHLRIASVADGGPPAAVVPAETIQAARPCGAFTFAACIVSPGFDFADFELLPAETLLAEFADAADLVRSLTR